MPSGTDTTTTVQNSEPWKTAQPFLKTGLEENQRLYESGQGFNPYPDSTVVPFSNQTTQALGGIEQLAGQGSPLASAAVNQAQSVLSSGGMSDWQKNALGGTYDVATGATGINLEPQYQGLLSQAGQPGAISQYLTDTASGAYLENGNPYFNANLDREAGALTDDINRSFSNMGRYGSGAHTNALIEGVGDFRSEAMQSQFDAERARQIEAAGMLAGEQGQNVQSQLGVLSGLGGVQGANIANQVGAGQTIFGAGNTAASQAAQYAGLAPTIYESQYQPYERLASVGSAYEGLSASNLQDQINRYQQEQQAPFDQLAYYNAIASGSGQLGGTGTSTVSTPQQYNYASPLGGALGGAQLGTMFGNPLLGALGGGALGTLGMFF